MVRIPDYFPDWLTAMVLGHFPEGDPEAMRRSADTWSDAANGLVLVLHRLQPVVEQLEKAVEGETGTEVQKQYRKIIDQIRAQIEFNNAMARQLYDNATAIEYQQYVLIGIAGALLAQVIIDMAMPPPGSIVKAIADRAEARAGMQLAQRDLVLTMLTRAARFVSEHPRLVLASKGVFFGTAIGGGVPYVAQRVQIAQGHRKAVDWQQVKIGAAAGAVGGLVGVEVGRRVAPAAMRAGGRVLGTVAAGGVGGMAGGLAGGLTAFALTKGELRGKDLATMVWTGFGSGLVGSLGASVRAARAGAYTGVPEPVASADSGPPSDAAPSARISAPGDGQPPQTQSATPEPVSTTSEVDAPQARRPGQPEFGDGSMDRPDDLTPEMMAEGDQILRDMVDDALARIMGGDGPGQLPDGSGGTTPGIAPDYPSGGSSHPSSRGGGTGWPAWDTAQPARGGVAVAAHPEGGPVTPLPARQFQISDPQVRPDQQGINVITEGAVTQPDIAPGTEVLFDDGSSAYAPIAIEHGPAGEMYLLAPEHTAGQDMTGPRPSGGSLDQGATTHEAHSVHKVDFDAEIAALEAELAQTSPAASADTTVPSVEAPMQAVDAPPAPATHTATDGLVAGHAQAIPDSPPAVSAATDTPIPGAQASAAIPKADPAQAGYASAAEPRNPVVPSNVTNSATPSAAAPTAAGSTSHTGGAKPPLGPTPPSGSQSTGPLAGPTPGAHTNAPITSASATPQTSSTPPPPIASAVRPGTDDEPDAVPEEFPTPPGTVVDDPREHNVQKDPREHSVQQDPRDHNVQKKPAGDYVTIPGVSYPLEDEPPADAITVIPHTPVSTPLPNDSVGLGRAFQNPDDSGNTPYPTSPRPPDITNPLSDRHSAAPETDLDAGLGKTPDSLAMPSRYATEPNSETPGAPQKPAAPHLNPHSLEYSEDPSRLPAIGGVPHLSPAPQPKKREGKRLVTRMGAEPEGKPKRRKKQPPPPPPPPEDATRPPISVPTPGVRSDAKNSDNRSSPLRDPNQQGQVTTHGTAGPPRDFTRIRDGITAAYRQTEGAGELHPVSQALARMELLDLAILSKLSPLVRRRVIDVVSAVEKGQELSPLQGDAIKAFVRLLPMEPLDSTGTLTDLELTELRLVAEDKSLREIGTLIGLKETTVRAHLVRIERKLGAEDRVTAVVAAIRDNILPQTLDERADRARSPLPGLTPRETEVLALVAEGKSSPEIATQLDISVAAVDSLVERAGEKLGSPTRAGMVAVAVSTDVLARTTQAGDSGQALPELTQREIEVLTLIAKGKTSAEIAGDLALTSQTVESYASRINRKLGVGTRAGSVAIVIRTGIIPPIDATASDGAARPELTPREREVLGLVAKGENDNEIAAALGLTRQSVKTYVFNINQKFGTHHRAGMAAFALRTGNLPLMDAAPVAGAGKTGSGGTPRLAPTDVAPSSRPEHPGGGGQSPGPVVSFQDTDPFASDRPARKRHRTSTGILGPDGLDWGVVNYKNPVTGRLSGMDEPEEPTNHPHPDRDKTTPPTDTDDAPVEPAESPLSSDDQPPAGSRVPAERLISDDEVREQPNPGGGTPSARPSRPGPTPWQQSTAPAPGIVPLPPGAARNDAPTSPPKVAPPRTRAQSDPVQEAPDTPALVRAARNGDSVAFDRLRANLADPIVQWMSARTAGDRAAAEELTEEVFTRAAAGIGRLRAEQDIKQWLGVIARNVLVEHRRYERLRDGIWASYAGPRNTESGPQGGLLARADRATVLRAVHQLPSDHRKVLVWRFEQDKTATQIAESMPSAWESRTVRRVERRAAQRVVEMVAAELGVVVGGQSAQRRQQWRLIQDADPVELERHIHMLPERQREVARLLLPGRAKALGTSPRRLKDTLYQQVVPALATLLAGGVVLTDHEAVMLTRAAQRHDPAVLAPYAPGLDPLHQKTFEQFFMQRRTVNEMAAAEGSKPKTIYMRVYRVARFMAQKVPRELRESYTNRGLLQSATTSDVAREAGVSQSTAEKVLRGAGEFAPETKRRVLEAADRLGHTFVQREGVAPPLRVVGPAEQYRYLGGDAGYRMTRYEAHVLFESAVRSGTPTVGDFSVRIPDASTADGIPLFPEHELWQMMPPHVQRFRKVLHLLSDVRLPDGRILDSSTPVLIEQRPLGAVPTDFQFDRLRAMVLRSMEGLRRALGEVPVEPLRQWLPGFPEDRDTEGFLRFLTGQWTAQVSRYRQAGWAEMFTDLEIPGPDPFAAILEQAIFMIPARFEVLHGRLGRENIRIDRGRITAITGWGGALIGDPAFDWAWLNHRGTGDYVPSRLRPPNMPIYESSLHVRRVVHGAVELVAQGEPDPDRIAEYAASYAIVRRLWGLPTRNPGLLRDIFEAQRRRLAAETAARTEPRTGQPENPAGAGRQTPWSGGAPSAQPEAEPLVRGKSGRPTPWQRTAPSPRAPERQSGPTAGTASPDSPPVPVRRPAQPTAPIGTVRPHDSDEPVDSNSDIEATHAVDLPCAVGAFADAWDLGFDVRQPVDVAGPVPAAAVSWLAGAHHRRFDDGLDEVAQLLTDLGPGAGMLVNVRPVGAAIGHLFLLHNDGKRLWIHDRQATKPKAVFDPGNPPFAVQTTHALVLTRRGSGNTLESRQQQLGENIAPADPDMARGRALRPVDAGALPPGDHIDEPSAATPISRGRPSDTTLELMHRYLNAVQAADGQAQELLMEVEQHIPDTGERAYVQRFAENERRTAALAEELGIPLDRLRTLMAEELRRLFDGEIVTRATSGSLRGILESGRFKTEFDFAGQSRMGRSLLAGRVALEQALFGYPPDLPTQSRPIYGFIRTAPSYRVTEGDALAQYGDIDIVFKSAVEERTTANVGDTKSVVAIPSRVTDPQPESFAATPHGHKTLGYMGLEGIDRDYTGKRFTGSTYIEAQVHGATVADIDYVVFHASPPDQHLRELLDAAGIPWSHFFRNPSKPSRTVQAAGRPRTAAPEAKASGPSTAQHPDPNSQPAIQGPTESPGHRTTDNPADDAEHVPLTPGHRARDDAALEPAPSGPAVSGTMVVETVAQPADTAASPAPERTGAGREADKMSPFYGWDDNGRYIEFEFDDIWIIPVTSSDGKISGAGFPGDEQNADDIRAWGLTDNRPGNREFIPVWPVSDVATRMPDIAPTSQWADDPQPEKAPYFDAETNFEPIVLFAHAEENGYLIGLEDRQTGQRRGVLVDGVVFGRIVWSSDYFQTAFAQHPGSQLLLVGCSAAAGDAHRLLSNHLHKQGFTGDVWGGRDIMLTSDEGHVCIRIEVAPDGTMVPPFDVTRAPGSPHEEAPADSPPRQAAQPEVRPPGQVAVSALDLVSVTSAQLIELLDSGRITSVQLTQLCLHRIEALSALNAVIGINPQALEEAARADELRRTGAAHGPLLGVPVLIKGNIDIAGMPTTAGSVALADSYPATDATLVTQLRDAGAVILGHGNLTEFAFYLSSTLPPGYSSYGGQALNPIDSSLTPGGSSSGSAVGVAAGLVPLAIGTQTTGSVVGPSNWNSIVGLKPTVGAVSRTGVVPIATTRDTPGAMSPDVTGAAVLLTALVGVDPQDPATAHNPLAGRDFTADLNPEALRGARIGVMTQGIESEDSPRRPLWDAALNTLKARGATLITVDLDASHSFQDNDPPWSSVFSYEFKRDLNAYLSRLPADAPMKSLADIIAYNNAHAETALRYGQDRALAAEAMDLDADSTDTATYQADLQADIAESKTRIDAVMAEHGLTALVSVYDYGSSIGDKAGYPCIIVPAGRTPPDPDHPAGEHVNVTFRAAAWSEPTLIGYAYAFEQAHAVPRPRPQFADQLYHQVTAEDEETAVAAEGVLVGTGAEAAEAESSGVFGENALRDSHESRTPTTDAEPKDSANPREGSEPRQATRSVGLIGHASVPPWNDIGGADAFSDGGPSAHETPRQMRKRLRELGELHIDGGGWVSGGGQRRQSRMDPDEAAAAAVRDLPADRGDLNPDLTVEFVPLYAPDGLRTEEDLEAVAMAVADMMRERGWRDRSQIEAATELVRGAGRNAMTYMERYTRSLQRRGVEWYEEQTAVQDMKARLTLRMSTQADARSLYVSFDVDQYRPERYPDIEMFTWHAPLFSHAEIGAEVRELLGPATMSGVEQWGEVWARFEEPRSEPSGDSVVEPPSRGDLEAKARIVRKLFDDHRIRFSGWEDSVVPVQAVESADRALRDLIAEYGGRFALRYFRFDDEIEGFGLTQSFGTTTPDIKDYYVTVTLNSKIFTDPEFARAWAEQTADHRWAESAEDMIYQLTHHEFIHVVADEGNWALHHLAPAMLRAAYELYRALDLIAADVGYTEWLAQLPHYSLLTFTDPVTNTFDPVEGVAEGARAGAVESSLPLTHPARVLHWLTVTRDGSSPAEFLARWAQRQASGEPDISLLLQDFRDVTGRDDIAMPPRLRPGDTTVEVLAAATGGHPQHFADAAEIEARLRAWGESSGNRGDGVSALVVLPGQDPYLLVRRASPDGTARIELRNPVEGVLRANHVPSTRSPGPLGARAMFFDQTGAAIPLPVSRESQNEGDESSAPPEAAPVDRSAPHTYAVEVESGHFDPHVDPAVAAGLAPERFRHVAGRHRSGIIPPDAHLAFHRKPENGEEWGEFEPRPASRRTPNHRGNRSAPATTEPMPTDGGGFARGREQSRREEKAETHSLPERGRGEPTASVLADTAEPGQGLVVEAVPHTELTAALATYGDTGDGWTGADSTYSRRLPDGRHLWMFSDTFLGTVHPDGSRPATSPMVKNTFVVDDQGRLSTVHGGTADAPTAVVPSPKGQMLWVGGGYVTGNILDIMLVRFVNNDPDDLMWGLTWDENVLARFDADDLSLIDLTPMPSQAGVMWSAWLDYDGTHTYVYGTEESGSDKYMHVARVSGDDLRARWEFFDGEGWTPNENDSARIMPGVANEYSVTRWRDRYLLITQDTSAPFSAEIWAYLSDSPTGPFTSPTLVYRAPEAGATGSFGDPNVYAYNAHEHPDLRSGDTLIVSYNVNSLDFEGVVSDVSKYRPRFVTVRLNPGFGSPSTDAAEHTPGPEHASIPKGIRHQSPAGPISASQSPSRNEEPEAVDVQPAERRTETSADQRRETDRSEPDAPDGLDPATNPVLAAVLNPAGDPAFDRMEAEHFPPVFEYAMRMQLAAINDIVAAPGPWTADNALRPFVRSGLLLGAVKQLFAQKAAVDRDPATAEAEPVVAELQNAHESRILTDSRLATIFQNLHERRGDLDLSDAELGYLERKYKDFQNAGAYLSTDLEKRRLSELNSEVAVLQTAYKDNQERALEDVEIRVDDADELRGLTGDQIEGARSRAGENGGYLLPKPPAISGIWYPYLTYLNHPALRQRIYEKVAALAITDHDNSQNVLDQVRGLAERAEITGHNNHAEFVMSSGIFDSTTTVKNILDRIARATATAARVEFPLLAEAIGAETIQPWDRHRALDVLISRRVGIDEQRIREFFELDQVLGKGVFRVAKDLFELTITEVDERNKPPVWHEDVRVFAVLDKEGQHLTNFYFDPYARAGKNGGEWTDPIRLKFTPNGQRPLISVHLNLEKPPTGRPTLLAPNEVDALFHEFGHALHFLLGVGTHEPAKRHLVFAWIEFVAKVFQQFWKHPDVVANYAVHHQTGEPMPPEMLEKLDEWRTAYRGTITVFRLAGAYVDLAWSSLPSAQVPQGEDPRAIVQEFEKTILTEAGIYFPEMRNPYPSQWFRHLFAQMGAFGTYSGQYWSYLLSDVLASIVFGLRINPSIERHRGLTPETGKLIFDEILRYEENNLAQATRRLIGSQPPVEHFLMDQRLLWPEALLELGTDATPAWLTTPAERPPGTDLESWWNDRLTPALRAAMIQAFPSEVLAMDIALSPETVAAAEQRRMTLLEYSRDARTAAAPSEAETTGNNPDTPRGRHEARNHPGRLGDRTAAGESIRTVIEEVAPQWPIAARTAAYETAAAVLADAARHGATRTSVVAPHADVLRVAIQHEEATDLDPELVRTLQTGATSWRAESFDTNSRRVVIEFHLRDDTVSVPERADGTAGLADDPVVSSRIVRISPGDDASASIRALPFVMIRPDMPFWNHIGPAVNEAAALAETLVREVSQDRRAVLATTSITRSGRWTLEVVEDGAETPRSGRIVYRPSDYRPRGDSAADIIDRAASVLDERARSSETGVTSAPTSQQAADAGPLRVVTWNFAGARRSRSDEAFDYLPDLPYFVQELSEIGAEVVFFQESEVGPDGSNARQLAGRLGYQYVYETVMCPSHMDTTKAISLAVLTNRPIEAALDILLPATEVELRIGDRVLEPDEKFDRYAQAVRIAGTWFVNLHPTPLGFFGRSYEEHEDAEGAAHARDIEQLLRSLADGLRAVADGPIVFLGDFNTDDPASVYRSLIGELGLTTALDPAIKTVPWGSAPDQVMVSAELRATRSGITITETDHYPVATDLSSATSDSVPSSTAGASVLDLPPQRARGLDGLGFDPPSAVADPFGGVPRGVPHGVVAHAADPNLREDGAFTRTDDTSASAVTAQSGDQVMPLEDTNPTRPATDSGYWAEVDAAIERVVAINPAFEYLRKMPKPAEGAPFGAEWVSNRREWFHAFFHEDVETLRNIELTEKDLLELARLIKRAPLYMTLMLVNVTGSSIDQLVHEHKVDWRTLFFTQEKITRDGETIPVWKFRTLRVDAPPEEASDRNVINEITPWARLQRTTSMDELPQLALIAAGIMQYYSGRPMLNPDIELMDDARRRGVITDEEYAFWLRYLKDDLWSAAFFPGCRWLEAQGDDYLKARVLCAFIWSRMGSRAAEEYLMEVVDRYLFSTVLREGAEFVLGTATEIVESIAGLLPGQAGRKVLETGQQVFGGVTGAIGNVIRGVAGRAADLVYPTPENHTDVPGINNSAPDAKDRDRNTEPRTPDVGADREASDDNVDLDEPLYVAHVPDDLDEPLYVVTSEEEMAIDRSDEPIYSVSPYAHLSLYPVLRDLLPVREYRHLGGDQGVVLPRTTALALRDTAVEHGQPMSGSYNNVYLLGDFAIRIPKEGPDRLDFVLWPKEYQTLRAFAQAGVQGVPRVLHVELDDQGEVLFEIQRRIYGEPVTSLHDLRVLEAVVETNRQLNAVPVPQTLLPLPAGYPESGDSVGFFRMLMEFIEQKYQRYRSVEPYRTMLARVGLGASLRPVLESEIPYIRSQRFTVIHGDLTDANILATPQGYEIVDFGLALYGPKDYEAAVFSHRSPSAPLVLDRLHGHLEPWLRLLDVSRVFIDTVRLVDAAKSPESDHHQLFGLAWNVAKSLARAQRYGPDRQVLAADEILQLAYTLRVETAIDREEDLFITAAPQEPYPTDTPEDRSPE
ncbi:amidase family protein [Nocardia gamkensis]|uniref:amidase family protein n=1 Tax=Nocardia gamkensis TaxID=352869 RepID=UPI0037C96C9D